MINNVTLMGRLVNTPELKTTAGGVSVTSFRLAVDSGYVGKDGNRQADYITIVAWRTTAEFICRYFDKGNMLAITGQIQTRSYQAKDGSNRVATEVLAEKASFTGEKATSAAQPQTQPQAAQQTVPQSQPQATQQAAPQTQPQATQQFTMDEVVLTDDDLPF